MAKEMTIANGPTNSFVNNVMALSKQAEPEVGMGATLLYWTDRYPATIIEVVNKNTIKVQLDRAIRIDTNGMSDAQQYEYKRDPQGSTKTFTRRKNGRWVQTGEPMRNGLGVAIGVRQKYHDFSF